MGLEDFSFRVECRQRGLSLGCKVYGIMKLLYICRIGHLLCQLIQAAFQTSGLVVDVLSAMPLLLPRISLFCCFLASIFLLGTKFQGIILPNLEPILRTQTAASPNQSQTQKLQTLDSSGPFSRPKVLCEGSADWRSCRGHTGMGRKRRTSSKVRFEICISMQWLN